MNNILFNTFLSNVRSNVFLFPRKFTLYNFGNKNRRPVIWITEQNPLARGIQCNIQMMQQATTTEG